jgi:hypothetical protein
MSQQELLKRVVEVLSANGIDYMVTGSVVSSSQGQPRATHDIDLVVQIAPAAAKALVKAFPAPDYYLDEIAVREAIVRGDMFNLLDVTGGDKVDFWILAKEPFDQNVFARRIPWDLAGVQAFVSRPEDTILQKLRWAEMSGGSEKQFGDSKAVYELQYGTLELDYMEQWAKKLDVVELWERLKREAQPLAGPD